tara:strand:+ start:520 stop:924 length:405 start_codon:yes stop_codon:yes gene_type:complete
MKKLLFIILILFAVNAKASSLPNCPSDSSVRWHNCFTSFNFIDGSKYIGEWKDDEMHGQGTYTYANGDKYLGGWKDNKFHGQGIFTWANGNNERGYYMNGIFVPNICHGMGLTKGSEPFGNCVVSLINEINEDD